MLFKIIVRETKSEVELNNYIESEITEINAFIFVYVFIKKKKNPGQSTHLGLTTLN